MNNDSMDRPYTWYQDLFCRDLGLCSRSDQDWGAINFDPSRVEVFCAYFLEHPEYSRVGREMLLESICESANERMRSTPTSLERCELLVEVVRRAIDNIYDRDVLALYWQVRDAPNDPNPLYHWIRNHFPGWTPPPSIWSVPR